jgi:hypothetical protein
VRPGERKAICPPRTQEQVRRRNTQPRLSWRKSGPAWRYDCEVNALDLDAALAEGADPDSSKALALRAQQLADPKRRAKIARSIDQLLDVAERRAAVQPCVSHMPTWTQGVESPQAQLLDVADRLEGEDSPPVKGLAMADLLVEDAGSPLYVHQPAERLRTAVEAILAALDR